MNKIRNQPSNNQYVTFKKYAVLINNSKNLAQFPYGVNIGNILTVNSSPRSRLMAEVIEKTGLIERSGQGVDIMFTNCIKEGKPLPDYSYFDDYQVDLRFYGEIPDDAFYLFAQDMRNLIEGLCKTPLIASHGNARATRYNWVDR